MEASYRPLVEDVTAEPFCYLTTRGRVTGRPHEIEIWFAQRGSTIYMLSGGGRSADWVKNLLASPEVEVRIREQSYAGVARLVEEPTEDTWARSALFEKYDGSYSGDLTGWSRSATPIAVDVVAG
jgi:deazaflavin-dependent oxidoreductase (nitroreductase family)